VTERRNPVQRVLALFALLSSLWLIACEQSGTATPTPQAASTQPTATSTASHATHPVSAVHDDADLVATLYEMLGHLEASRANLDHGNWTLAQAHAAHPTAEYWASIEAVLRERNLTTLREPLDAALQSARDRTSDAAQRNDAARQAIRDAIETVLGSGEHAAAVRAAALAALAEATATELAEGVENGQIVNIEEFQDAWGFFHVLSQELPRLTDAVPPTGEEALAEAREDLEALSSSALAQFRDRAGDTFPDDSAVRERLVHLAAELRAAFGVSAPEARSAQEELERIRVMLDEALALYRQGNTDAAYEKAADAYLEGFENLEAPLLDAGHRDLVERLELDFKAVRDAIREGRPADEVAQMIEKVTNGLREVEEVLQ